MAPRLLTLRALAPATPVEQFMSQAELQRDVRSAISITYELLRHEHILQREPIARALGDLESELARIEAKLGGPRREEIVASTLDPYMDRVEQVADAADRVVAEQIRALVASLRDIQRKLAGLSPRTRPHYRRRASPARAHVLVAGAVGLGALASVALARTTRAKAVSGALGALALALAASSGQRHDGAGANEAADGAVGAALAAAPFALGYSRRDPGAAAAHAMIGLVAMGWALAARLWRAQS
jgi:hypothetical protein